MDDHDRELITLYGVCTICHAPRDVVREQTDESITLRMVCTANAEHDQG